MMSTSTSSTSSVSSDNDASSYSCSTYSHEAGSDVETLPGDENDGVLKTSLKEFRDFIWLIEYSCNKFDKHMTLLEALAIYEMFEHLIDCFRVFSWYEFYEAFSKLNQDQQKEIKTYLYQTGNKIFVGDDQGLYLMRRDTKRIYRIEKPEDSSDSESNSEAGEKSDSDLSDGEDEYSNEAGSDVETLTGDEEDREGILKESFDDFIKRIEQYPMWCDRFRKTMSLFGAESVYEAYEYLIDCWRTRNWLQLYSVYLRLEEYDRKCVRGHLYRTGNQLVVVDGRGLSLLKLNTKKMYRIGRLKHSDVNLLQRRIEKREANKSKRQKTEENESN